MDRELIVVGGPNGAGKTTFALSYREQTGIQYLAADDIASQLCPGSPESVKVEAGKEFSRRLGTALESGESLLVESTLSGKSFLRWLARARALGYRTRILFVTLESSEACMGRVRERVLRGGHNVPDEDIRRRYSRSQTNFWRLYRPAVDSWHLYQNADDRLVVVAFGDGERTEVEDEGALDHFLGAGREIRE